MVKYDGHVHTPFCPHGTKDTLKSYCEKAIEIGLTGLSFTEHAPLPETFTDPAPKQDSAMSWQHFYEYIDAVQSVKDTYKNQLTIGIGLEVDYIEGFEEQTTAMLNEVGSLLNDSILSVHFLKHQNQYTCIDYSPEVFAAFAMKLGSNDAVHQLYYQTVLSSINADLGIYKPKRIGHITLANKFQSQSSLRYVHEIDGILNAIQVKGYALDYNVAGIRKPLCKESYPPLDIIKKAISMNVPIVFGSDAHQAKEIPIAWNEFHDLPLSSPL